jgi:hypothetical protein
MRNSTQLVSGAPRNQLLLQTIAIPPRLSSLGTLGTGL